ncbi:hypothetical protein FOB25_15565 [Citrobacter portucalensis]|nr:hypothetical protein D3H39_01845 [Citrobacter portucalensis]MBK2671879.1 hypothetical protein [Citrobacter freundii]QET57761.1 hypothetical protein FOB25_15565 [Citrobacter portucalensis]
MPAGATLTGPTKVGRIKRSRICGTYLNPYKITAIICRKYAVTKSIPSSSGLTTRRGFFFIDF